METVQLLLVVTVLAILAEVTYLVVKLPRQNISRKQGRPILVDTSVLIDGRIIAVARSGFIGDTLVVPRSVVGELQYLADNADHDKRARARYGLDVIRDLQAMPHLDVEILQDGSKADEGVDERLLTLAKKHNAAVCTIDYNLNKVAVVEGITVLNVNELAQSLRMAYLPGEKMLLELVQKGQDAHQGVGYLTDGTMVVVEHSSKLIGQTVEIEFIRSLQTAAGKMMFARRIEGQQTAKIVQKPIGKRLVKPVPHETPVKRPQYIHHDKQHVAPKREHSEPTNVVAKQTPGVYHSDTNDRQLAQHKPAADRSAPAQRRSQSRNRKPPTSADREASLIDLVDKQ